MTINIEPWGEKRNVDYLVYLNDVVSKHVYSAIKIFQ